MVLPLLSLSQGFVRNQSRQDVQFVHAELLCLIYSVGNGLGCVDIRCVGVVVIPMRIEVSDG